MLIKNNLARILGVDPRTIERWQNKVFPMYLVAVKVWRWFFDSTQVIEWYALREKDIRNEKLCSRELENLRAAGESDLQSGWTEYKRYCFTKTQANGQELKNVRETGGVINTGFCMYAQSKLAQ
ncbi:terminase small subunit [Escherichia albertii]|nr:terminase small subunit [Escherichia albertii]